MGLIAGIVNESLHHKMIIIESVHELARVGENMTTWRATKLCIPHHTSGVT